MDLEDKEYVLDDGRVVRISACPVCEQNDWLVVSVIMDFGGDGEEENIINPNVIRCKACSLSFTIPENTKEA